MPRPGINWNTFVMRKHGSSIREKIFEVYKRNMRAGIRIGAKKCSEKLDKMLPPTTTIH